MPSDSPHNIPLRLTARGGATAQPIEVSLTGKDTLVALADPPDLVLLGTDGVGYGRFAIDSASRRWLLDRLETLPEAIERAVAWDTLWEDLIDGLIRLMNSPDDVTGPINIGNPVELTMIELAEAVIGLTGSQSPLVHEPLPHDDPLQRKPDITLARNLLGWEPSVGLDQGLAATIAYFTRLRAEHAGSAGA